LIGLLTTGFFIGILLVFYTDLNVKLDVLKFIIPLLIFSLAIINILMSGNTFKVTISFFSVVLFGFFNGLGSSTDLEQLVSRHEAILTPILEVVFGFGAGCIWIWSCCVSFGFSIDAFKLISTKNNTCS